MTQLTKNPRVFQLLLASIFANTEGIRQQKELLFSDILHLKKSGNISQRAGIVIGCYTSRTRSVLANLMSGLGRFEFLFEREI